jgi:MFS family permease
MTAKSRTLWTFAITSVAVFMATLDNLVVTTALPVIREDLDATIESLEWTVNAYTLTFAVLLLTGAALGDRFGRRRMLAIGLGIFTVASAAAALAPSAEALIAARALQGVGGAIITPLTLTILSAGVPAARRGAFIGAWSGIAGLAVAFGPLVGGAVVSGISWHWIFWLNVPIGIALIPLALRRLDESHGPAAKLDLPGLGLASAGLTGIVWGLVRGHGQGWTSPEIVGALTAGALVFALFIRLSQFFQTVQGYSPLGSGLRILPWTIMPMFVAPIAGALSDRVGGARLMGIGLTLQAGGLASIAAVSTPTTPYWQLVAPFMVSGIGMAMFWAPVANVVLAAVRPEEEGQASGAQNAIRELGGVFGVAVLASVFSAYGGYRTPETFVDGMSAAVWIGAGVVLLGAVAAFAIGKPRAAARAELVEAEPLAEAA